MSVPKPTSFIAPAAYDMEYRSTVDDAWYSVLTVLDGEKLRVQYDSFSEDYDNVFEPKNFKSLEEIDMFEKRFRRLSNQLQDNECKNLSVGTVVCASHSFGDLENRFYDGVVDDVLHREHCFANGEEQCTCTFVVFWKHGPFAWCLANKKIENVCVVQSKAHFDSEVAIFCKMAREKLESERAVISKPFSLSDSSTLLQDRISSLPIKHESTFIEMLNQETKFASLTHTSSNSCISEERIFDHAQIIKEEVDVGGVGNQYVVLIDNMDKHLSPSTITQFIHRSTSISVQAYVFPCLSSETYTNGALLLNYEKSFQKLCEFLDSPDHIIMSRRGRPWVITAKLSGHYSYLVALGNLIPRYQDVLEYRDNGKSSGLELVCSGSEEYRTAKRLRDVFIEFAEHQQRLHKRLALEENKILQSSLIL